MSGNLPHEVFEEILLRLPTKSLIRFRCVSKLCNSIITNSNFITTHLHRPHKHDLFLFRHCSKTPKKDHYSLHFDNETLDRYLEPNFPFQSQDNNFQVVGCCNGLVCLVDDYVYYKHKLILWNPSIRKSFTLPAPRPLACKIDGRYVVAVGFGFDSRTNDYKVVRILNLPGYGRELKASIKVQLYSLSTNSWKTLTTAVPYCGTTYCTGAFTNENFHWLAYYVRDNHVGQNFILSFDMSDEVREIMIPESLAHVTAIVSLSVLRKSICLLQKYNRAFTVYDVWVMREYGVAESWTKLFSIDQLGGISNVLGFRNSGDSIHQMYTGELVLHSVETKELKNLGIQGVSNCFYLNSFVESLVLINHANDADSGKVVEKKRKSRDMASQDNTSQIGPSKASRNGMEIPDLPSQMVMAPTDGGAIRPFSIPRRDLGKGYPVPSQNNMISKRWSKELNSSPVENHVSSETQDELPSCGYRALKTSLMSSLGGSSMESDEGFLDQENLINSHSAEVLRGSKANQVNK